MKQWNIYPMDIGTIWVHSPSVMQGYLNDAPSPIVDEWLNTGDLGSLRQ